MAGLVFDKARTALLIADFYAAMMDTIPHAVGRDVVGKTVALRRAARDAGVMVCYCATVFRPGYPEIGGRNKTFGQRKASGLPAVLDPLAVIHPAVAPAEGEVVVGKHRVNALYGTGLEVALRANDVHSLIILAMLPAAWCCRPCGMLRIWIIICLWWRIVARMAMRKCMISWSGAFSRGRRKWCSRRMLLRRWGADGRGRSVL